MRSNIEDRLGPIFKSYRKAQANLGNWECGGSAYVMSKASDFDPCASESIPSGKHEGDFLIVQEDILIRIGDLLCDLGVHDPGEDPYDRIILLMDP